MVKELYVFGAGGIAKEVTLMIDEIDAVSADALSVAAYVATCPEAASFLGKPVIAESAFFEMLEAGQEANVVLAIGTPGIRRMFVDKLSKYRVTYQTLVHPTTKLNPSVSVGEGVVFCANVVVTMDVVVGSHSYVNFGSTLAHDVNIGEFVQISPRCCISGGVTIRDDCFLGAGSIVHPNVTIDTGSSVGLGSVVLSDVGPNTTVLGNPARRLPSARPSGEAANGNPRQKSVDKPWHLPAGQSEATEPDKDSGLLRLPHARG